MKTKVKKTADSQHIIDFVVGQDHIAKEFDEVLQEFQENAQVKGFRRGKAPREDVKKMYEKEIREETLKRLIFSGYRHAIETHAIRAFGAPEVFDVDFKDESLTFKIKTDVWPEVKVDNYRQIPITANPEEPTAEEIREALEYIRGNLAEFIPLLEDRPVQEQDYVLAKVIWSHEGRRVDEKDEVMLSVDEKEDPLGIARGLVGLKTGASKSIPITLPADFHLKELAGKNVIFDVTVKQIKKRLLPELNDEYAKKVGFETRAALEEEIKKDIARRKKIMSDLSAKKQILQWCAPHTQVDIPQFILRDTIHRAMHEHEDLLKSQGKTEKEAEEALKGETEAIEKKAREDLKIYFALRHVAEAEKITADEKELNEYARGLAARYSKTPQEIEHMLKNEDFLEDVRTQVIEHKTIDFLLNNAIISKV